MRLTWVQPEDLLLQEFVQARAEGLDPSGHEERWLAAAGGSLAPPVSGAADEPATPELRALAGRLLDELDALPAPRRPAAPRRSGRDRGDLAGVAAEDLARC